MDCERNKLFLQVIGSVLLHVIVEFCSSEGFSQVIRQSSAAARRVCEHRCFIVAQLCPPYITNMCAVQGHVGLDPALMVSLMHSYKCQTGDVVYRRMPSFAEC